MFEAIQQRATRSEVFMTWLVQFSLSYPLTAIAAWPLLWFYSRVLASLGIEQSLFLISVKAVLIALTGFVLAILLGSRWPSLQRSGVWNWFPVSLIVFIGLIHDLLWPYAPGAPVWRSYFDPHGPGELTCALRNLASFCDGRLLTGYVWRLYATKKEVG